VAASLGEGVVGRYFRALGDELACRGHRVTLITDGRRVAAVRSDANPAILTWPSPRPTSSADARFLAELVRRHRPDCLIASFGAVNVTTLIGLLYRVPERVAWYRTSWLAIQHDSPVPPGRRRMQRARKRLVYRAATHVVANSYASRDDLMRVFRVPAEKIRVLHNVAPDPLPGLGAIPPRHERRVVCVGRMDPSKGHDVLLRAVAVASREIPDLELELVGDGPWRARYERAAAELGIAGRARFAGGVAYPEVPGRLAVAAVSVVPSRAEAFGNVNVETMGVATPLVASNVGGIAEIVTDGVDGFLVPPGDHGALAGRLVQLLRDPPLRRRLGEAGRQTFLRRFELGRHLPRHADHFERIVGA
jgi:glycosyltransferase involved in cell wall biosynthesis